MKSADRTKACKRCGEVKAIRNFYKHPDAADGYRVICKVCVRQDVYENREAKAEYYAAWRAKYLADPANREKHNAAMRRWRRTARGRRIQDENRRIWAVMNPEKHAEYIRKARKNLDAKRKVQRAEARA